MLEILVCPTCGSNNIRKLRQDWTDEFKGEKYTVPDLEYHACTDCNEEVYDRDAMRRIESYSPAFAHRFPERKSA